MRLAEKEELLLEKDLIFEQATRLSMRVKVKAEDGKEDTLELAKTVSNINKCHLNIDLIHYLFNKFYFVLKKIKFWLGKKYQTLIHLWLEWKNILKIL